MEDIAGWIALAATCVAALMMAANLGARVTGWGFVVFTIGAVAWIVVGWVSGQTQLLWSNIFLGLVDLFGIWRWLGRRAKFDDAARRAEAESTAHTTSGLFSASSLDGKAVTGRDGSELARVVDAMTACGDGRIAYLIVREGGVAGVGETLRELAWRDARVVGEEVHTRLDRAGIEALPVART
ncbi:MAG: PRC-barrel domain containing protein [Sphingomonas sp.]|nr:MAG: PRC-barrel domain containing protein [Sphingomonas sp.]